MTDELTDEQKARLNRLMNDEWKRYRGYAISENIDRCCFTCMYGKVVNAQYIECKIKKEDIPTYTGFLSLGGVCSSFYSVYLEDDND